MRRGYVHTVSISLLLFNFQLKRKLISSEMINLTWVGLYSYWFSHRKPRLVVGRSQFGCGRSVSVDKQADEISKSIFFVSIKCFFESLFTTLKLMAKVGDFPQLFI